MSDLDRELDRLAQRLPSWAARTLRWVRKPSSIWARYPLALILIAGGFVGFLPILGFWMIPLGLVLIAQDVPFLRRPLAWLIGWINKRWTGSEPARATAATPAAGELISTDCDPCDRVRFPIVRAARGSPARRTQSSCPQRP